jgi:uncharacterized membrane protein
MWVVNLEYSMRLINHFIVSFLIFADITFVHVRTKKLYSENIGKIGLMVIKPISCP